MTLGLRSHLGLGLRSVQQALGRGWQRAQIRFGQDSNDSGDGRERSIQIGVFPPPAFFDKQLAAT